jgi:hypothetical protein
VRTSLARAVFVLAAAWLAIMALVLLGMALFQEPDDGVWRAGNDIAQVVEGALALLAAVGAVNLVRRSRASRWTAVPMLVMFGALSGVSAVQGALASARGTYPPGLGHEPWLNAVVSVACIGGALFLLRRSTWAALGEAEQHSGSRRAQQPRGRGITTRCS